MHIGLQCDGEGATWCDDDDIRYGAKTMIVSDGTCTTVVRYDATMIMRCQDGDDALEQRDDDLAMAH